ncbi:hypothetical protein [Thermaerobacillus caldiproteolyticus]|nr:hypothetical protein [Anoxybacillus caldiproteolyticus]QPA31356.1 hypothetical protein ISX45_18225 [Anoxybacillus caldiproteolyticus]
MITDVKKTGNQSHLRGIDRSIQEGKVVIIKWMKVEIGDYFVIPLTGIDS